MMSRPVIPDRCQNKAFFDELADCNLIRGDGKIFFMPICANSSFSSQLIFEFIQDVPAPSHLIKSERRFLMTAGKASAMDINRI